METNKTDNNINHTFIPKIYFILFKNAAETPP